MLKNLHPSREQSIYKKWSAPATNIAGYWSSKCVFFGQDHSTTELGTPTKVNSMVGRDAPVDNTLLLVNDDIKPVKLLPFLFCLSF